MPKYKIIVPFVTFSGADVEIDTVLELPEKSGQALVNEGKAEAEGEPVAELDPPAVEDDEAEKAKQIKALDVKYNREEGGAKPGLAEAAKELGIEFAYDASKADIIAAVIASGKAALFL